MKSLKIHRSVIGAVCFLQGDKNSKLTQSFPEKKGEKKGFLPRQRAAAAAAAAAVVAAAVVAAAKCLRNSITEN